MVAGVGWAGATTGGAVSSGGSPAHVYVLDDTPAILELFRELLEDEGYRVTTDAFNVVAADQKLVDLRRAKPDVVILDFVIGGEQVGWQVLQLLKMDRETRHLPVIVCTGAVRQVEELQAHLAEMKVAVVLKPFDIDRLLAEVALVLREAKEGGLPAG